MVFLGSSCRETAKNAIKKNSMGKDERKKVFFSQLFRPKVFDMYFPKTFYGVFELPLLRNAHNQKKREVPTYLIYHLPDIRRFHFFFSSAPLGIVCHTQVACQLTYFAVIIASLIDHLASPSNLSLYPSQQKVRSARVSVSRTTR